MLGTSPLAGASLRAQSSHPSRQPSLLFPTPAQRAKSRVIHSPPELGGSPGT